MTAVEDWEQFYNHPVGAYSFQWIVHPSDVYDADGRPIREPGRDPTPTREDVILAAREDFYS